MRLLRRTREEEGTYAAGLDGKVPERAGRPSGWPSSASGRTPITAGKRDDLVGSTVEVLVDEPGVGRSHREAPEIDGIISVPDRLAVGTFATVTVTGAVGPDLEAA